MLTKLDSPLGAEYILKAADISCGLAALTYVTQNDRLEAPASVVVADRLSREVAHHPAIADALIKAVAGTLTVRDILLIVKPHVDRLHTLLGELESSDP